MKQPKRLTKAELKERIIRFYSRYGEEVEQIKTLLEIKLKQICLAYTLENKLPTEALTVNSRKKTLKSLMNKFEIKKWPQFYFPTEIITDLVGARITCWFLDDVDGLLQYIKKTNLLEVDEKSIEDYVHNPKTSGYRGMHLLTKVTYDSVQRENKGNISLVPEKMICEVQIRTKLQNAWGDITHEFYSKEKNMVVVNANYEKFISDISNRLMQEDMMLMKFRDIYQKLADEKLKLKKGIGFKDGSKY